MGVGLVVLGFVTSGPALGGPCQPATFIVNTTDDLADGTPNDGEAPTSGTVSLRAAIQEINAQACAGQALIQIPAGTYGFAITGTGEDLGAEGDLDVTSWIRIEGAGQGQTIIDANDLDRIFDVHPGARLELFELTLRDGALPPTGMGGGAIQNQGEVTLSLCDVESCFVDGGGGAGAVLNLAGGTLQISGSRIIGNHADANGGAIGNSSNDGSAFCEITRTLIANNSTGGNGGAIASTNSELSMQNVTVSGNMADGSGGGVIFNNGVGSIQYSTITNNVSDADAGVALASGRGAVTDLGAGIFQLGGSLTLWQSIVAGNSRLEGPMEVPEDLTGFFFSNGYNIIQEPSGFMIDGGPKLTDMLGSDPILLPLADNGGSSETHALGILSPAIDGALPGSGLMGDQRGFGNRPQDGDGDGAAVNDIGAFEAPGRCRGDADGDRVVNFADITAVLNNWLNDYLPGTGPGDAELDGVVNFMDITAVLNEWLSDCAPE